MENGVETIDISHVVEKKLLEDGVSEERVEEGVVAESPQLKDLEDEDVFEEAVDIPEDLLEERSKSDLQADMIDEDVKGKTNGDSEFGDAVENSSVDYKFEEAEGAIEATSEVRKSEEGEPLVDAEKEEDGMVVEKLIDVPNVSDETGNEEEVIPNESGKLRDDGLVSSSKDVEEVPVISPTIENEVVKRGDQFDLYSDEVINKAENEDSNNVNVELFHADEEVENEQAVTAVEEGNLHSHQGIETNTVIFNGSANHMELGENNLGVEEVMDEPINASANHLLEINDDKSAEPSDNITNGGTKHHDDESREIKDATAIPDLSIGNDEGEYLKYTSPSLNTEHLDHKIEEVKGTAIGLYPQNSEETFEMKDTSPDFHKSVDEGAVEMENGVSLSSSENINNEQTEKVQGSEAEENNNSQHQHSDNKVNNDTGTEELEKREKKDLEVKQSTHTNSAPTTQPAPEFASSSGKSTNSVPPSARPAGLGRAAPLLEPAPRAVQQPRANGTPSHMQTQQMEDSASGEAEENDETREKLQMIRVKFLRLAHRLGQTPHNVVVAQVLYRLGLAEQLRGRNGGRVGAFSFDRASAMAEQLEAAGQEPLDFTCTIMVLGKTGVGKSATINSIFDEVKFNTDAFQMGTKKVQDIVGTVQGIKVRVIDTPGLLPSWSDQHQNEKILLSVKRFIKKTPPDIVLYLDRLDMQSRDFSDMPLLRTITDIFGPSIWFNAIVVLTHAASAPPDGPNGTASGYDMFVTQRSHVVQQAIRQAAGDMRLMNPVSLVENHSACRTNRAGQRVLPNGQVWKPHLLLLSFASKILAEANALLKLQDSPPGRPFATRSRAPPLPFLLSSLLQSRPQAKLPEDQFGDEDGLEDDLDESSDSEDESEFDELPPFKRLTKAQVAKLSKAQKRAYFDELEYREKLFMKKQLKEDRRRRRMMKKMAAEAKNMPSDFSENVEEETGGAASVPVPMPDLALPASFDSDNPTHRYRYLDSSNQWLIRPVLETHGWDHDVGYEGINVERLFVVKDKIPISFSGQVSKDKKDANVQMEMTSSVKHGEGKATSLGFDMQTVGKDLAYTLRSETVFSNFRKNKATAGLSVTLLGDALSAGVKIEDKLVANKRFRVVVTGGAMSGRGDIAYGGSLEAQLRDKDYPLGRSLSTLGLSVMDWHGDLAIGCNIQSQIPVGQSTNLIGRANLNNRGAGQISIRLNSSEQLQIALIGLIPLARKLLGYPQQLQFGQ